MPKGVFNHRKKPVAERYWARVIVADGCWGWRGYGGSSKAAFRYPKIGGPDGAGCPKVFAHRVSWEIHNGAIPAGMEVCHRCDNPTCTNPAHLFLGTHKDNFQDMTQKGRSGGQRRSHCKEGHPLQPCPWVCRARRYCPICYDRQRRERYLRENSHRVHRKFRNRPSVAKPL